MEFRAAEVAWAESHALGGRDKRKEKKELSRREKVSKKRIRITFGGAEHESVAEDKVGVGKGGRDDTFPLWEAKEMLRRSLFDNLCWEGKETSCLLACRLGVHRCRLQPPMASREMCVYYSERV